MPAKFFKCNAGTVLIENCLKQCPISDKFPAKRCLTIRTLRLIADQRPWNGVPSTTQLLKGTREAFLDITKPYAINPQDAIYRVHGTKAHAKLDRYTTENEIGELRLTDDINSGQFDLYDNGILFDDKTWGSFKVAKALGLKMVETQVATGTYYKTGPKKGQPKYQKVTELVKCEPDLFEEEMQLNDYRIKLEAAGYPVHAIFVEALTRDANTWIAEKRGIKENALLIPIKILPDDEVRFFFKTKRDQLIKALETNKLPPLCSQRERWADGNGPGRKCKGYCNGAEYCEYGKEVLDYATQEG